MNQKALELTRRNYCRKSVTQRGQPQLRHHQFRLAQCLCSTTSIHCSQAHTRDYSLVTNSIKRRHRQQRICAGLKNASAAHAIRLAPSTTDHYRPLPTVSFLYAPASKATATVRP